jgi:hypothetical protein
LRSFEQPTGLRSFEQPTGLRSFEQPAGLRFVKPAAPGDPAATVPFRASVFRAGDGNSGPVVTAPR